MTTTETALMEEQTPNPYNLRKDWHTPDRKKMETADGLYFEPQQATQETMTPDEPEKKPRTNYKKRYDDLKKHYDQKLQEFKQKETEFAASQQPSYQPPKTLEDLEKFKQEHPDLYETVETVAHLQSQQQVEGLQQKLSVLEQREQKIARQEAEEMLATKHPDFAEVRSSDEFHTWAKLQPEVIQDWIYKNSNNVNLAIKAIDLYKLENNIPMSQQSKSQPKFSKEKAADFVSTKTQAIDTKEPKIWSKAEIAKMPMREFDKYEAEIDQAIMEGRVRP